MQKYGKLLLYFTARVFIYVLPNSNIIYLADALVWICPLSFPEPAFSDAFKLDLPFAGRVLGPENDTKMLRLFLKAMPHSLVSMGNSVPT